MHNKEAEVRKINLAEDVRHQIARSFSTLADPYVAPAAQPLAFSGSERGHYSLGSNHMYCISNYQIPSTILESISQPDNVAAFYLSEEDLPRIKNIFLGVPTPSPIIAFQNFTISQYFTRNGWGLFTNSDNVFQPGGAGLKIDQRVDCVFHARNLLFTSLWAARQTLDLAQYFREATAGEMSAFTEHPSFHFDCKDSFCHKADPWIRRTVAAVAASEVLDQHSVADIAAQARKHGIDLDTIQVGAHTKLVVPDDKAQVKTLLHFLAENIYAGPLTDNIYLADAKKAYTSGGLL